MQYWISDGTQQFGPFPLDQLRANGLQPHWLVWNENLSDWTPASQVPEVQALFAPSPAATPSTEAAWSPPVDPPPSPAPAAAVAAGSLPPSMPTGIPQPKPLGYAHPPTPRYMSPQYPLPQTMAIVSLIMAIASFLGFPTSIFAVIFGHIALGRIRRGEESGRGMAIAGLVIGYIGLAVTALALIIGAFVCAIPCMASGI